MSVEIRTLYAIRRGGSVVGVFTQEEAAQARRADAVEIIPAPCLPASQAMPGYVAMARGKWASFSMTAQGVHSETFRPGPCWGANVQTAIAGLFAPGGDVTHGCIRRRITLTQLRLYRLDHDYGAACPENLHLLGFASRIADALCTQGKLSETLLKEDCLAAYHRLLERRREQAEISRSEAPDMLCEHLLAIACRRAPGKRGFCGFYLSRVADSLRSSVRRHFTLQEMRLLAGLLALPTPEAIPAQALCAQEQQALLTRLEALVPRVRRTTGLRHENEDPHALAHAILHPEEMLLPDEAPDVPDD